MPDILRVKYIFFLVFLLIFCSKAFSEENTDKKKGLSYLVVPIFAYTTDTGTIGGMAGMKSYRSKTGKLSNVQSVIQYSEKKQFTSALKWDHYRPNDDRLKIEAEYTKFPILFFGLGNKTESDKNERFTPEFFEAKVSYEKAFKNNFKLKTFFYMNNLAVVEFVSGGMTLDPEVKWRKGRFDAGPGIGIIWDSRDNNLATKTGSLVQVEYWGIMLQDRGRSFNGINTELKKFFNPRPELIFAYMVQYKDFNGTVPFYLLSDLGGADKLRGYEQFRFLGKKSILLQHDIRFPVWGPFGGIIFGAAGQVADKTTDVLKGRFHTGYGGGGRFSINKEDNLVVRFDYASGSDTKGFYITFSEAF